MLPKTWVWVYDASDGTKGAYWMPCSDDVSDMLEMSYMGDSTVTYKIGGILYTYDHTVQTQRNCATGYQRKIKRFTVEEWRKYTDKRQESGNGRPKLHNNEPVISRTHFVHKSDVDWSFAMEEYELPLDLDPVDPITHEVIKSTDEYVKLKCGPKCIFLASSIIGILNKTAKCPTCRKCYATPETPGPQPSGTMEIRYLNQSCDGHEPNDTHLIIYSFPPGVQTGRMQEEGKKYPKDERRAFIPMDKEGIKLVEMYKKAFQSGVLFLIGTSFTHNCDGVVVWGSIPHKTSVSAGSSNYGYPDADYYTRAREACATFGIE